MKFSHCGRLLASAGQDNVVRIWVLKNAFDYFNNMRMKYNTEGISLFMARALKQKKFWVFGNLMLTMMFLSVFQAGSPLLPLKRAWILPSLIPMQGYVHRVLEGEGMAWCVIPDFHCCFIQTQFKEFLACVFLSNCHINRCLQSNTLIPCTRGAKEAHHWI